MNKKDLKEFCRILTCLLNSSVEASEVCEIMYVLENYGGSMMPKWKKYCDSGRDLRKSALKDLKKILKKNK